MGCRPGSAADFELDVGFEVIGHRLADRRGIKLDGLAVLENEMTVDGEVGLFDLHFDTTVAGCRDDTAPVGIGSGDCCFDKRTHGNRAGGLVGLGFVFRTRDLDGNQMGSAFAIGWNSFCQIDA